MRINNGTTIIYYPVYTITPYQLHLWMAIHDQESTFSIVYKKAVVGIDYIYRRGNRFIVEKTGEVGTLLTHALHIPGQFFKHEWLEGWCGVDIEGRGPCNIEVSKLKLIYDQPQPLKYHQLISIEKDDVRRELKISSLSSDSSSAERYITEVTSYQYIQDYPVKTPGFVFEAFIDLIHIGPYMQPWSENLIDCINQLSNLTIYHHDAIMHLGLYPDHFYEVVEEFYERWEKGEFIHDNQTNYF